MMMSHAPHPAPPPPPLQDLSTSHATRPDLRQPGELPPQEALARGWCPHPQPFLWPAPRLAEERNALGVKPSEAR
jgi:hypothetical protein